MNVLSLFDGISCGQLALKRACIPVTEYYVSEIDKYAIKVTQSNYPDTVQLGDITKWKEWELPEIDLLIAGFPCQAWSLAGKQRGDNDPRGALVHDLIAIWKYYKPKHFMFENVKMKKEFIEYINGLFGVEPILINSALVSAQNRQRLYWTNIPGITQPENKGLLLKDIIESGDGCATYNRKDGLTKEIEKAHCMNASDWRGLNRNQNQTAVVDRDKSYCIDANYHKGGNLKSYFEKGRRHRHEKEQLTYRKLTPVECCRLQTLPDDYFDKSGISNTQRYKSIGNGWTVDVVAHIFKGLIRSSNYDTPL